MDFVFDPALVLYLPLYEPDGASFRSKDAYGHLCTVTGALWTPQGGSFDGVDDYIDCGNNASLDITSQITVEAWVCPKSYPSLNNIVVGKFQLPSSGYNLGIRNTNGIHTNWGGSSGGALDAENVIALDVWWHIVATYGDGFARIYVNGTGVASEASTGAMNISGNNVFVGRAAFGATEFVNGRIGEVRIYNRALTASEIQRNYLATKWRYR